VFPVGLEVVESWPGTASSARSHSRWSGQGWSCAIALATPLRGSNCRSAEGSRQRDRRHRDSC